jgi:hypothetical protein
MSERAFSDGGARAFGTPAHRPRWQWLKIGDRVTPVKSRKHGTVVAIVEQDERTGVSMRVTVRWDGKLSQSEEWPTDFLVVLDDGKDRPGLAALKRHEREVAAVGFAEDEPS